MYYCKTLTHSEQFSTIFMYILRSILCMWFFFIQWCNFFKSSVNPTPCKKNPLEAFCQMLHHVTCRVNCCSLGLFHFFKWRNCIENMEAKDTQSFINLHKTLNFSFSLTYAICSNSCLPEWWTAFILPFVSTWKKSFCHKSIFTWGKNNITQILLWFHTQECKTRIQTVP